MLLQQPAQGGAVALAQRQQHVGVFGQRAPPLGFVLVGAVAQRVQALVELLPGLAQHRVVRRQTEHVVHPCVGGVVSLEVAPLEGGLHVELQGLQFAQLGLGDVGGGPFGGQAFEHRDHVGAVADLDGKSLSVGAAKSGTELNARAILKAAGLSYADLGKVEYLPFGESVELMKNRQLDATLQSAGLGVASIRDLATAIKIVVVPVPADVVAKVGDPAYQPAVIPANTYAGQTTDVPAVAIPNFLVSHSGVSNDLAYQMTKALYTNIDTLYAAHNSIKVMKRENAIKGMPVPLHPGAERYYREVGLIK